jgi:DNA mismatch repair ATPase MutS
MKNLEKLTLSELKDYRELLNTRIAELNSYQIDDDYFPPHTDEEFDEIQKFEEQAKKALSAVNKIIRKKLDDLINSIIYE